MSTGSNTDIRLLEKAVALFQAGMLDAALSITQPLSMALPPNAAAVHLTGLIECKRGHLTDGLRWLNHALRLEPSNAEFFNNLGGVLGQLERFDEADIVIREALRINPSFGLGHFNRGVNRERQGDLQMAEKAYRCAMALLPQYPYAQYRLACVLHLMARYAEADQCMLSAFEPALPAPFQPIDHRRIDNPAVLVVVTCKGRLGHLRQTLPPLLAMDACANYRVAIVDYDDPDGTFGWCISQSNPRLVAMRVLDRAQTFNLSRARNCGANVLPSDVLCFVDADSIVDRQFLRTVIPQICSKNGLLTRRELTGRCDTSGLCCVRTSAYRAVRGYDEFLQGYGPDDMDFYSRIRQHGPLSWFKATLYPRTISHSMSDRTRFYTLKDPKKNFEKFLAYVFDRQRRVNPTGYGQSRIIWSCAETNFETRERTITPPHLPAGD